MALCQKSSLPLLVGMPLDGRWMEGPVRFSLPCWGGFLSCPVSEPRRDAAPGQNSSLLVGVRFLSCPASKLLSVPLLVGMPLNGWLALSRPLDVRTVSWVLTPQGLSMGIPHPQEFTMGISSILTLPGTN